MLKGALPGQAGVGILALPLTSCMPCSKSLDLLEPQFLSQVKRGWWLRLLTLLGGVGRSLR